MATTDSFIQYVCEQLKGAGVIRSRKMFGEYMVYVDDLPVVLVCNDIVYVKMHDCIEDLMKDAQTGVPYDGAKSHYILDIDDKDFSCTVVKLLKEVTPMPKKKKK